MDTKDKISYDIHCMYGWKELCNECNKRYKGIETIQVDAKEYERLKQLAKRTEYINPYPYGIAISTLEESKEDKDHSTLILLIIIIILQVYIIWKQI